MMVILFLCCNYNEFLVEKKSGHRRLVGWWSQSKIVVFFFHFHFFYLLTFDWGGGDEKAWWWHMIVLEIRDQRSTSARRREFWVYKRIWFIHSIGDFLKIELLKFFVNWNYLLTCYISTQSYEIIIISWGLSLNCYLFISWFWTDPISSIIYSKE